MPIFKVCAARVTSEEAVVYVYADDEAQAREKAGEDLDDIIESHSAWDVNDFALEEAEIAHISEVDKIPKMWTIPDELDFRTEPEQSDPEPEDPRQMRMFDK